MGAKANPKFIILHGKDRFRKNLYIESFKEEYLQPGFESLCFSQIDKASIQDFVMAVNSPAFAFGKIILVKNFEYLEKKSEENEYLAILDSFKNLPENIVVIFDNDKITGTIKLVKELKSLSGVSFLEFEIFEYWQADLASRWLSAFGLDYDLATYIVEILGPEDSGKLYSELIRLKTIAQPITKQLIDEHLNFKSDAFALVKFLLEADKSRANQELDRLIQSKEAHLGLLALIDTNVSSKLKLKLALDKGLSDLDIASLLGLNPKRIFYLKKELTKIKLENLNKLAGNIIKLERKIKQGKIKQDFALKLLVNCL